MIRAGEPAFGWRLAAWLAVLAVALWLRLWHVHAQFLFDDEWHALHKLMRAGYWDIFSNFGGADHSIPLTLLYKSLAGISGLNELVMRIPSLAAGVGLVFAVPWLLKPWLERYEGWLIGLLLAISPLLIFFSRQARPYALVALGVVMALLALWQWRRRGGHWAWLFAVPAVLAAWLHPLMLIYIAPALTWCLVLDCRQGLSSADWRPALRIILLGGATALAVLALLLVPFLKDWATLGDKVADGRLIFEAVAVAWQLFAGSGLWPAALLVGLLAIGGAVVIARRAADLAMYLGFVLVSAIALVILASPAWIQSGGVLARYLVVVQVFMLALAGIGLGSVLRALSERLDRPWLAGAGGAATAVALYLAGPLPEIYRAPNNHTMHYYYQADYNIERSLFREFSRAIQVSPVMHRIAAEEGDWTVIDTPYYFESYSPLMVYQRVHRRPVRLGMISGLCVDWTFGEIPPDRDDVILRNHVYLSEIIDNPPANHFLVFHRTTPVVPGVRELPRRARCQQILTQRLGQPWYEDELVAVWRFET